MEEEIAYKILWATIEDFTGLWEIFWEINTDIPNAESENKKNIKQILHKFLVDGLVVFYTGKWGSDQSDLHLDIEESVKALDQEENWSAPDFGKFCIKIGSTEKGEKYYTEELL
jgi:hypothetical protein